MAHAGLGDGAHPAARGAREARADARRAAQAEAVPSVERFTEEEIARLPQSSGSARYSECAVCMEAERDTVFLPCSHVVACAGCATRLTQCPVCRAEIHSRVMARMS